MLKWEWFSSFVPAEAPKEEVPKTEIERYLDGDSFPELDDEFIDNPMLFWNVVKGSYPELYAAARRNQ